MTHRKTGDTYVGSTNNIRTRYFGHRSCFRSGKHARKVMALVNKHGDEFDCAVLELTGDADRYPREQHWIDTLKPTLNGRPPPKEDRRKAVPSRMVGVRLPTALMQRVDEYCRSMPFRPRLTQVVVAALRELLDAHDAAKSPRPNRK